MDYHHLHFWWWHRKLMRRTALRHFHDHRIRPPSLVPPMHMKKAWITLHSQDLKWRRKARGETSLSRMGETMCFVYACLLFTDRHPTSTHHQTCTHRHYGCTYIYVFSYIVQGGKRFVRIHGNGLIHIYLPLTCNTLHNTCWTISIL